MIHLRQRPDAPGIEPAECGATNVSTLYDMPTWPPHVADLCPECAKVRRAKNRGTFRSFREGAS